MRRGESEADTRLVTNFIAAAAFLQQDASKLASEITKSRSLDLFVAQVMRQCCCDSALRALESNVTSASGQSSAAVGKHVTLAELCDTIALFIMTRER